MKKAKKKKNCIEVTSKIMIFFVYASNLILQRGKARMEVTGNVVK